MSAQDRIATPNLSGEAERFAERCCSWLGLGHPVNVRRLAGGRSGSPVLGVEVDGTRIVLKMTTDPERLARAELEVRLLRSEGVLDGIAPELVASATAPGWVAIATQECTPLGPAQEIDDHTWTTAARTLATLHRRVVDLNGLPRRQPFEPNSGDVALTRPWAKLGAEDDAIRGSQRLAEQPCSSLPEVLEHGDSHLDNILRDPRGALVWIDWQEAHIGDGLSDLVFLWQRAEFDGAQPPRQEMTRQYTRARHLDPDQMQPLIDQVELRLLLHSWPPFLSFGTSTARASMRHRLAVLANG